MPQTKPTDNYQEFISKSYKDTDALLIAHYPADMDVDVYEGSLIDNYIGYQPRHIDPSKFNLERQTKITTSHTSFNWIVILEEYVNSWTSQHRIYYTNDDNWVDQIKEEFEQENDTI